MNALSEIYRKLVPAGVLGLIWNIEECEESRQDMKMS